MPNILGVLVFSLCLVFVFKFFPFIIASLAGLFVVALVVAGIGALYIRHLFKKAQKEFESMNAMGGQSPFENRFEPPGGSASYSEQGTVIHVDAETVSRDP